MLKVKSLGQCTHVNDARRCSWAPCVHAYIDTAELEWTLTTRQTRRSDRSSSLRDEGIPRCSWLRVRWNSQHDFDQTDHRHAQLRPGSIRRSCAPHRICVLHDPPSARMKLLLQLCIIALAQSAFAGTFTVADSYQGQDFINEWTFQAISDPTHGYVNYVDKSTAVSQGLSLLLVATSL